jgi:quercetin dioxygenase-like cupin family protein
VVLPFAFEAQASQFVVKVADIPDRGPGAAPAGKPGTGPARQAAFTVKVLADEANVRAQNVSLTMLTVGPASRVAMHRHPRSGKALYVMRGRARVLGPAGAAPVNLTEGSVAFVPVGYPHVIENMGRQEPVVFLQIFAPPGPEKVYRNPKDPAARADFEVIRDPGKVKPPAGAKVVLVQAANTPTLPILNGKGSVKILLEPKVTGSDAFALNLIEFAPGAEVARHTHPGSTELLFVTAGRGTMTIGSEAHPFVADDVLHVPPDQPHASKLAPGEKTTAIQIYAPAGPEQRFRAGGTAQPGAAPAPPNPPSQR